MTDSLKVMTHNSKIAGVCRTRDTQLYSATATVNFSFAAMLSCAPFANQSNSAQLWEPPCRVCAVVWACSEGQTHRHTDVRDHYTFRVVYVYDSREMQSMLRSAYT